MDNVSNSKEMAIIEELNDILNVDNSVDKSNFTAEVIKQKQKVITIDVDEEWIENNLIDIPFIYYYQSKEIINAVTYKWTSSDGLDREIQVRSSIKGVPSPFEYDVLLALMRIYLRNNKNKIIPHNSNLGNTIQFTFRELSKEMGYSGFGSATKKRLDDAIEKLTDTNIYNTEKGGLYNPLTKEYITDGKMVVGILHNYKAYSYIREKNGEVKLDTKSLKDKASVVIDDFFFNNIKAGKGKISNKSLRQSLKNDLSRRLYLMLNKWRNNRNSMFVTYEKLYERIPLSDEKSKSYRNKRIRSATKELVEKDFLADMDVNEKGITFIFSKTKKKSSPNTTQIKKSYNTYDEIIEGLKKYSFTEKDINKYLTLDKIIDTQAILRYVDTHLNSINKPKAYIIKGLKEGYKDLMRNAIYSEVVTDED